MRPSALLQNLRGRNIQGKQLQQAHIRHYRRWLKLLYWVISMTHWTDSALISRAAESSPVCASHHTIAPKMLWQEMWNSPAGQPIHKSQVCWSAVPPQASCSEARATLRHTVYVIKMWSSNLSPTHSTQSTGRTEVFWIHSFQLSCTAEKYQDFQGFS